MHTERYTVCPAVKVLSAVSTKFAGVAPADHTVGPNWILPDISAQVTGPNPMITDCPVDQSVELILTMTREPFLGSVMK